MIYNTIKQQRIIATYECSHIGIWQLSHLAPASRREDSRTCYSYIMIQHIHKSRAMFLNHSFLSIMITELFR